MRSRYSRQIGDHQAAYLQLLITDRNADSRKSALEVIAKLYRSKKRFKNPERFIPHIVFLMNDEHDKVRRWAFNCIALVGTRKEVPAIVAAMERERNNPDILAAAIAALSALATEEQTRDALKRSNLPLEGFVLLAAAQQSPTFSAELSKTRIEIDTASVSELRLATLLLGLRKAPENLLSARHDNKSVIGDLNFHDDELVSQYSVWAAYEDPGMSLGSLRIHPRDFQDYHPGIRKYGYRLMTETQDVAKRNIDYVIAASEDSDREAREGLASGIRDLFFDGMEDLALTWFRDEGTETVRGRLLEHMAVNVDRATKYKRPVLETYERSSIGSLDRARLEAAAAGTSIFKEMKRIEYEAGMKDMFSSSSAELAQTPTQSGAAGDDMPDPQSVQVLLVTALPKEAAAVRATLNDSYPAAVAGDPAIYRVGRFVTSNGEERPVLTVNARMGTQNASTLGANALRSFPNIRHIIMVGIAGGCPNPGDAETHVRLGDIVISSAEGGILEYDFIKKTNEAVEIRRHPQRASAMISSAADELAIDAIGGDRKWETLLAEVIGTLGNNYARPEDEKDVLQGEDGPIEHPDEPDRRLGKPKVISGVIGSADILQKDSVSRDELRDRFGVRAIEMEASGLQTAAWAQGKDIFVVRGICDYCDTNKNNDWQNYAAAAAAAFARALIEAMPKEWF